MIDPSQMTNNAQRMALQGLAARLIQDGLLDEKTALQAISDAKDANTNLVAHLVSKGLADAREIAIAASQEFGVPLLDLDAIQPDLDVVRLVSDKLLQKHRVIPLARRGKRLFVATSDPTNVHALDEIKFQTSMAVEAVMTLKTRPSCVSSTKFCWTPSRKAPPIFILSPTKRSIAYACAWTAT